MSDTESKHSLPPAAARSRADAFSCELPHEFPREAPREAPREFPREFPHEGLDVYHALREAYAAVIAWKIPWSRGTLGDQLERALTGALLQYTEGYYADDGNRANHLRHARASAGEAACAVDLLVVRRLAGAADAHAVRQRLATAMRILSRLIRPA